ncbi:MAG: hypothetical protein V7K21_20030 [Nostoc sp.]|uniref:hypothetical protein n=1 Tax=Nostoc sp. TaxID=1180 RepID=UPI002FF8A4C7
MNAKDKQAVEEAKNKRQRVDSQHSPKTPPNVSGGMNDALMQTAVSLKEGMKKVVVPAAFMMLMEDFANGDYGDTATDMMLQFQEGMLAPFEAQHQALLQGRVLMPQQKVRQRDLGGFPQERLPNHEVVLLPCSGESTGSSSSTS